jgi:hypothetical protein
MLPLSGGMLREEIERRGWVGCRSVFIFTIWRRGGREVEA